MQVALLIFLILASAACLTIIGVLIAAEVRERKKKED